MARRKAGGPKSNQRRAQPRQQPSRVQFEIGEKSLSLEAQTKPLTLKAGEAYAYVPLPDLDSVPTHLRLLGVTSHLTLLGDSVTFLEGPSTVKTLTKAFKLPLPDEGTEERKALPTYKVIGPADAKPTLIVTYQLKYKDV
jgi:hypothetical protein